MNEMIERVAREIAKARNPDDLTLIDEFGSFDVTVAYDDGWQSVDIDYLALARAAIAAMREPTEAMGKAYWDAVESHCMGVAIGAGHAWGAMINAALKE